MPELEAFVTEKRLTFFWEITRWIGLSHPNETKKQTVVLHGFFSSGLTLQWTMPLQVTTVWRKMGRTSMGKHPTGFWPAWLLSILTAASGSFGYAAQLAWAIRRASMISISLYIYIYIHIYIYVYIYIHRCAFHMIIPPKKDRLSHWLHSFLRKETHWFWCFL